MKCILLAAGYATRLYPLTLAKPKALLRIGDRLLLTHIMDKIAEVRNIDTVVLVSNHKFIDQFRYYFAEHNYEKQIVILDDGTETNENRIGALADLSLAITRTEIDDEILVLAADNLFDFSLVDFVDYFFSKASDCISAHRLADVEALKRTGVALLDKAGKVLSFEEKPFLPKSTWAVPPFYVYKKSTLPLLREYLGSGADPDAPGNFIPWLLMKRDVYAYRFIGNRYDIGTPVSYKQVDDIYKRK